MQAQTEQSVHTDRAREQREREREREQERGREGGRERKRLHLLDAPALGSLPTSVSREGSEQRCRMHTEKWKKKGKEWWRCVYRLR